MTRDDLGPPQTALGRAWNGLLRRAPLLRFVDQWWYQHSRIAHEVGSWAAEGTVYAVCLAAGVPAFIVIPLARLAANIDEFHTLAMAVRYRDFSLINESQQWERTADGHLRRTRRPDDVTPESRGGLVGFVHDFRTERRRLPSLIVAVVAAVAGLTFGAVFHLPVIAVAAVSYTAIALQWAPALRNAYLSVCNRTWAHFNRPQTIARPDGQRSPSAPQQPVTIAARGPAETQRVRPALRALRVASVHWRHHQRVPRTLAAPSHISMEL